MHICKAAATCEGVRIFLQINSDNDINHVSAWSFSHLSHTLT